MTIALLAGIVCLAFMVEATLGFGATLVSVTLGALIVPVDVLLPAFVPVNLGLSLYIAVRYRRDIAWRLLLTRVLPLMAAGLPLGMWLYRHADERLLVGGVGAFVAVLSALQLLAARRPPTPAGRQPLPGLAQAVLLLVGGVLHGAYTTGGPFAVYVAGRVLPDKGAFRSTLSLLWLLLNAVLVVGYGVDGSLDAATGQLALVLAGSLAVGVLAGDWLFSRVSPDLFRSLVFALLLVAGLALVVKSV